MMLKIKNDSSKYIKRSKVGQAFFAHNAAPKKIASEREKEVISRIKESSSFYIDLRPRNK